MRRAGPPAAPPGAPTPLIRIASHGRAMRLLAFLPLLLAAAGVAAPAALVYPFEPGQRWTCAGTGDVLDLGPDLTAAAVRRLRWQQQLHVLAAVGSGEFRAVCVVDEREELSAATGPRLPVIALCEGRIDRRGAWREVERCPATGDLFLAWAPQLALPPLPAALPSAEGATMEMPVWIGSRALDGRCELQRLSRQRVGRTVCDRWRARLAEPLTDVAHALHVPTWDIEVLWDTEVARPARVRTTLTLAQPAHRRQTQAQITFDLQEIAALRPQETRALPKQLSLLGDVVERAHGAPAEAGVLARRFLKDHPGVALAETLRLVADTAGLRIADPGDIAWKTQPAG